jgi:hypothetical protein
MFRNMNNRAAVAKFAVASLLVITNVMIGFPADIVVQRWNESQIVDKLYLSLHDSDVVDEKLANLPTFSQKAEAANFSIKTGYYVGNGSSQSITGVGFQPGAVIIRGATAVGTSAVWKSSAMASNVTAFMSATADDTTSMITLNAGGFSLTNNANVNSANVRYTWVAFAGSDCTASGTFCAGTYSGNGTNPRKITTGFQPGFVLAKRNTALAGGASWRTASMADNMGQYMLNTAQVTNGSLFTTLVSDGFNVGTTNNTSGGTYYYLAFKSVAGVMAQGTYSGNGTDNRSITGFGAGSTPNFAIVKNATSATTTTRNPLMNFTHSFGDSSNYIGVNTANATNMIQALQSDGIQIGSGVNVNESGATIYWAAFGGAAASPAGSGSFDMAAGSYTGNGTSQTISGLDFSPDLVIIKGTGATQSAFRTSLMAADNTAYLANAAANFTGGITSLTGSGFSVGASTVTNTSGTTYHWQAFGGAYKPGSNSGASDFAIGAYMGTGMDSRDISDVPFQPNMITAKRNGASAGVWRSSSYVGDLSSFFAATAEGANRIQTLNTNGFQIGTQAEANASGSLYHWFAFMNGSNFTVNNYTGTGASQTVNPGFQPDLVWVKRNTNQVAVHRGSSIAGNSTQNFGATADFANGITGFSASGFSLTSTTATTNASGGIYRYAAWRVPPPPVPTFDIVDGSGNSVPNPNITLPASNFSFDCTSTSGILGTASQRLRITNPSGASPQWSLSIAATDGAGSLWRDSGNTQQYDFNDGSGSPAGCLDGGDSDGRAGQLSLNPSSATITPQNGCAATNISSGSATSFQEDSVNAITLMSASSGAQTGCYWDVTGVGFSQYIPGGQPGNTYTINLTVTITAL